MKYERERSHEEAEAYFEIELKKLALNCSLNKFGSPPFQSTVCNLFCGQNKVSEGGGKGIGIQSELSAKYEALEHYTSQLSLMSSAHESFSLFEAKSMGVPLIPSKIFPDLFAFENEKLPWIGYQRLGTQNKAYIPAICTHPFYYRNPFPGDHFDYMNLYLSATTNGFASGCTRTEALIHAILEVVERHSLSLFMIEVFCDQNTPKILNKATLPNHLKTLVKHITEISGYDVIIFELPNELTIPCYGAHLYHPNLIVPIKGYGAALNSSYAIERALLEALQGYHEDPQNKQEFDYLQKLNDWPDVKKCAEFNFSTGTLVPYAKLEFTGLPDQYLDNIVSKLNSNDFSIYVNETYSSEYLTTVHVIIPEAEEFFSATMGLVVPIKNKGALWAKKNY